jgi:hypothetical protein
MNEIGFGNRQRNMPGKKQQVAQPDLVSFDFPPGINLVLSIPRKFDTEPSYDGLYKSGAVNTEKRAASP